MDPNSTPTAAQLYQQLKDISSQVQGYTPANAGDIYKDLASRVNYFEPQYREMRQQQANAYAAPATLMEQYRQQYAEPGSGPSAMSQMSNILQEVGRGYGTANVMGDVIGAARGRLENMSSDVLNQYNAARQSLLDKYGMISPVYQTVSQQEEAARARDWQAQQDEINRQFQAAENEKSRRASAAAAAQQAIDFQKMLDAYNTQSTQQYQDYINQVNALLAQGKTPQTATVRETNVTPQVEQAVKSGNFAYTQPREQLIQSLQNYQQNKQSSTYNPYQYLSPMGWLGAQAGKAVSSLF